MILLSAIFTTWIIAIVVLNFFSTKWSVALFLSYSILVPVLQLMYEEVTIGSHAIYIVLCGLFYLNYRDRLKELDLRPFYPFAFLMIANGALIPFQEGVPFLHAADQFVRDLFTNIFYPFIVYTLIILEEDSWRLFKRTLFICGAIFVAYGLFLTTMPGINPYLMMTLPVFGKEFNEAYALGYSALATTYHNTVADGRLFGRISSVFGHPMTYGLHLGFLAMFTFFRLRNKILLLAPILFIIVTAVFTSGIRTPIAALALTTILILLYTRNFKYAFYGAFGGTIMVMLLVSIFPSLEELLLSMVNSDSGSIKGSSMEMRMEQLMGCFDIIKDNMVEGMGYKWTSYYNNNIGSHPVLLSFESLIFVILCNQGLLGIAIWVIFAGWTYYEIRAIVSKEVQLLLMALFIYYVVYSTITGDYGYMKHLMIYYIIAMGFCYEDLRYEEDELLNEDENENEDLWYENEDENLWYENEDKELLNEDEYTDEEQ